MIDDEKIIEMFFERSEQGNTGTGHKIRKSLSQSFLPYSREQIGRGGMCKRRLFRCMERHSPSTT